MSDSATTAPKPQSRQLSTSGPATGLSKISGGINQAVDKVGSTLEILNGVTLPKSNSLFDYASYTYSLGLGVLTKQQYNNPDSTYMSGAPVKLICKSGNADPMNRISTVYGQFDFYIEDLVLESNIGRGHTGNIYKVEFNVIEPRSFGLFMISLEQGAKEAGWLNWRDAYFLLTVDFKGNRETGEIQSIPGTSRKIAIKFISVDITVTGSASTYVCKAYAANNESLTTEHGTLKSDVSIKGKTVQEVLQTGEKSLQAVLNARLQQFKKAKIINVPDEILIIFPTDVSSASTSTSFSDIHSKLKLTESEKTHTFVQKEGECNELGRASMNFSITRKGDSPIGKEDVVYDPKTQVWVRGNNTVDFKEGDFRFGQGQTIYNAIEQIMLQSEFPSKTLEPGSITKEGFRKWWRIETQTYVVDSDENYTSTGKPPLIHVYRVVPFNVHPSKLAPPNIKVQGVNELIKSSPKEYNYIYTGKNLDIIRFDINYGVSFTQLMAADTNNATQDGILQSRKSTAKGKEAAAMGLNPNSGAVPDGSSGGSKVTYSATNTPYDKQGGGGIEDAAIRAAKLFHTAVTTNVDMINLEMQILGDPDWIIQSGVGNYVSKPSNFVNLNGDGTINWQNGEVDLVVNFRTPVDLNQNTGLYDFGESSTGTPIHQFCGAYCVISVESSFRRGLFTQILRGYRRSNQEAKTESSPAALFSATLTELVNLVKGFFDFF